MHIKQARNLTREELFERKICYAVYILYVTAMFTAFLGAIAGLVIALIQKDEFTTGLGRSHAAFQVKIFLRSLYLSIFGIIWMIVVFAFKIDLGDMGDPLFTVGIVLIGLSVLVFVITSVMGMSDLYAGNKP